MSEDGKTVFVHGIGEDATAERCTDIEAHYQSRGLLEDARRGALELRNYGSDEHGGFGNFREYRDALEGVRPEDRPPAVPVEIPGRPTQQPGSAAGLSRQFEDPERQASGLGARESSGSRSRAFLHRRRTRTGGQPAAPPSPNPFLLFRTFIEKRGRGSGVGARTSDRGPRTVDLGHVPERLCPLATGPFYTLTWR